MTGSTATRTSPALLASLAARDPIAAARAVAIGLAVLAHLAILAGTDAAARVPRQPAPGVTEIELAPPPPPPPEPEPPPSRPPAGPKAAPMQPRARSAPRRAPARPVRVITVPGDASGAAPVDFATDPEGNAFTSQVVASGAAAPAPAPFAPTPRRPAVTAPENVGSAARLDEAEPCSGFYPAAASANRGSATVALIVRASGAVKSARVVDESPRDEGFGASARSCLEGKKFIPARDHAGRAVTAAVTVRVRFSR